MNVMSPATPRFRRRALATATGLALLASPLAMTAGTSPAQAAEGDEWTYSVTTLETGATNAYDMAYDAVNRKAYYTDGAQRTDTRTKVPTYDTAGNVTGYTFQYGSTPGTGKVIEVNTANSLKRNVDYTGLTRITGVKENAAHSWDGVAAPADGANQTQSQSSLRTHFSPNGIAVDPNTTYDGVADPTIISTHVRQQGTGTGTAGAGLGYGGGIVIWKASQGAPTDADRLWKLDDETPISDGSRRIAVNSVTHKAYIGNFATGRSANPSERRGFITVIDLPTKTVEARVAIPAPASVTDQVKDGGPIGVTVDEVNNDVYVGQITQDNEKLTKLFRIDADGLNTSNPKNKELNASKVVELDAAVPGNARPTYVPEQKRLYVSSYQAQVVSVVDADLASATYGTVIETIQTGRTNSVEVDAGRKLLFSANLQDKEIVVYSTDTYEELLRLPTSGNVSAIAIDPVTGQVWANNFGSSSGGVTDVFTLHAPKTEPTTPGTDQPAATKTATTTTVAAPKKVKANKKATITATVSPVAGGDVTVTATKGKKTKTATGTVLSDGRVLVTLPKLKKGKWTLTAAFAGSPTHQASTSAPVKVKVKK